MLQKIVRHRMQRHNKIERDKIIEKLCKLLTALGMFFVAFMVKYRDNHYQYLL